MAASAFALQALAFGVPSARKLLMVDCRTLMGIGLGVSLLSGLFAWLKGLPFLTGIWDKTPLPVIGKLGTPLFFDIGVFIVVLGVVSLIVFVLADEPIDSETGEDDSSWN